MKTARQGLLAGLAAAMTGLDGMVSPARAAEVIGVAGLFNGDDPYRVALAATSDGNLREIFYHPDRGEGQDIVAHYGGIVAIAGFFSPDDNFRHAIVGTSDGSVHETVAFNRVPGDGTIQTHVGAAATAYGSNVAKFLAGVFYHDGLGPYPWSAEALIVG